MTYHDQEWGVPVHDDRLLFEFLILEGVQAGLNWSTVLKKRAHYRKVYDDFIPEIVAKYREDKVAALLQDPGIIRNRLKIMASIKNARAFLDVKASFGTFDNYIWSFVSRKTIQNHPKTHTDIPTHTIVSDTISKDLKKRGFTFVGSTICYAYMQAVGIVNDHTIDCFRHSILAA